MSLPPITDAVHIFDRPPDLQQRGSRTWLLQAQRFLVAWTEVYDDDADPLIIETETDYMALLPEIGGELIVEGVATPAGGHSVCIVPAGRSALRLIGTGRCIRLFAPCPVEWSALTPPVSDGMPELRPIGPAFRRRDGRIDPRVHVLDVMPNSPGMPRAKLFQSMTLSINWVEYDGPRDRSKLSPHNHADFEQGSLALAGQFIHHLRLPWGADAAAWRDDLHVACGPRSIALIPPPVIHTTEGVGSGRHVLIDIFAPPRRDFIAKGQILNAMDYIDAA